MSLVQLQRSCPSVDLTLALFVRARLSGIGIFVPHAQGCLRGLPHRPQLSLPVPSLPLSFHHPLPVHGLDCLQNEVITPETGPHPDSIPNINHTPQCSLPGLSLRIARLRCCTEAGGDRPSLPPREADLVPIQRRSLLFSIGCAPTSFPSGPATTGRGESHCQTVM